MNFLHYKVRAGPGDVIRVSLSGPANVRLLDTLNYYKYSAGKSFQSSGESTRETSAHFKAPHKAQWHVVVDLKGHDNDVRAYVDVLRGR